MQREWRIHTFRGDVVIIDAHLATHNERVTAMQPTVAALQAEHWFPLHSGRDVYSRQTLLDICRQMGPDSFRDASRYDSIHLRVRVKRALGCGRLITIELPRARLIAVAPPAGHVEADRQHAAPRAGEGESIRFRLLVHGSDPPAPIIGAKLVIEFEDGRQEIRQTNGAGEILLRSATRKKYRVVDVLEPFLLARVVEIS